MIRRFHDPFIGELAARADATQATMFLGILAALAAAAGIGRAISGIVGGHKQGVQERTTIKNAYAIANRRTNEQQAYARQGSSESLNARGVLNGGVGPSPSAAPATPGAGTWTRGIGGRLVFKPAPSAPAGTSPGISPTVAAGLTAGGESADLAKASMAGQSGDASTISGQTGSDLSREFYGEHQDQASQRDQGLNASLRGQSANVAASIGSGIDVGTAVYNAGSMIQGAFGAQASPAAVPTEGQPNYTPPVKPGSWFGGYDPTDPLGIQKRGRTQLNDQFNVKKSP